MSETEVDITTGQKRLRYTSVPIPQSARGRTGRQVTKHPQHLFYPTHAKHKFDFCKCFVYTYVCAKVGVA